jgi:hypothetical protein
MLYVQTVCPDSTPSGFWWLSGGGPYTIDDRLLRLPLGLSVPFLCIGEVTGSDVAVRFDGFAQQEWADPRFLFGPWQPVHPPAAAASRPN